MSKVYEAYLENSRKVTLTPEGKELLNKMQEEFQNMSEKEKCLYYGISCSFGICDECELYKECSNG